MSAEGLWVAVGFIGQAFFSARFLVQWLASEKARRSIVPTAFWFFSLGGGANTTVSEMHRFMVIEHGWIDDRFIADHTVGFEALARWTHPTRGFIPPSTVIPPGSSGLIL